MTQADAWQAYDEWIDEWIERAGATLAGEPAGLEELFRGMSSAEQAAPKEWVDAYLAAFSQAAGMLLVTFDRALAGKVEGSILLV